MDLYKFFAVIVPVSEILLSSCFVTLYDFVVVIISNSGFPFNVGLVTSILSEVLLVIICDSFNSLIRLFYYWHHCW